MTTVDDQPEYLLQFKEAVSTAKEIADTHTSERTHAEDIIALLYYKLKDVHRLINSGEYEDSALVDEVINLLSDMDLH